MSDQTSIQDLNKLVMFSGRLSEVHIKNMKSFPWIFFNDLKEFKLDYSIGTKRGETSLVVYDLSIDTDVDNLDKRAKALESAVRSLFWKETSIALSINGHEVYQSPQPKKEKAKKKLKRKNKGKQRE